MTSHRAPGRNFNWRNVSVPVAAAVVLLVGAGVHVVDAATAKTSAACTAAPSVTYTAVTAKITMVCTIPLPSSGPTSSSPTPTPTDSPTPSVTPTPTDTTSSPTPTPTPSPTSTTTTPAPPTGTVTGQDITPANTGVAAWRGDIGEPCTTPTIYPAVVKASALGQSVRCAEFKKGVTFDQDITITASRFDASVDTNGHTVTLNWDTIAPATVEDICVHGDGTFLLYRSTVTGCSDAVRFDGDSIIESYLRTKAESAIDHNDAVQAYQASAGGSILRSNIDAKPVNAAQFGIDGGNGAIFLADSSKGTTEIRDNYLAGGGYTLRLNESQHYRVTGNVIAGKNSGGDTWLFGPLDTTNSVAGAFLEWSGNTLSDGTVLTQK